jgi:uncharacterized protein YndB with AHSA1/START domain
MTDRQRDEAISGEVHAPVEVNLLQDDSEWTLVMRRKFPHGVDRLWQMLTEPELLAQWSPVVPDRVLDHVGLAVCRENPGDEPIDAEVLIADAPRKLVHRWGSEVLSWTLTRTDIGSELELRQTLSDHLQTYLLAAGWQVCMARLAVPEDGIDHERATGQRALAYGWEALAEHYRSRFGGPSPE